jgi:Fe-S cluster assembly protein SufD
MIATDYKGAFEAVSQNSEPDWLSSLRAEGYQHFEQVGWPTRRHEEWKYTSTKALQEQAFFLASAGAKIDETVLSPWRVEGSIELVFVDGVFNVGLSRVGNLPAGLTIETFGEALSKQPDRCKDWFYRPLTDEHSMFEGLNGALFQDGLHVHVAPKAVIEPLIHVLHVSSDGDPAMIFPRQVWHVESSAQATAVQTIISGSQAATFLNAVTEMRIDANAQLNYGLIQAESHQASQMHTTRIQMAADSRLDAFCLTTGGGWVRNELGLTLDGSNIDATANGLYLPKGNQHIDNHTVIDHREPNSLSNQLYKGVLDGKGRAVFNGKIFVRSIAQQTNAYQLNRNLLLSPTSEVDTKPQLEIFADDVRCTHGATIGPVNPDEIFYLQSRGIARDDAIRFLAEGFARETLSHMHDTRLQEILNNCFVKSLAGGESAS